MQAPDGTREDSSLDKDALSTWWNERIGEHETLHVRSFAGGQSNPTYWVHDGAKAYVLRKKPEGALLKSAHAVDREARVMKALADTDVPVPTILAFEESSDALGTPFFVMEHLPGRIFWKVQLPTLQPEGRRAIYDELARVLARLHAVDPDAVGLGDYGRREGYMARQVARWTKQYEASKTDEVAPMETLIARLPGLAVEQPRTTLVHGDYRLDNLIFDGNDAKALALIDWELSTLGHPLADVAYVCMLYDVQLPRIGGLQGVDFEASGIPSEDDFLQRYASFGGEVKRSEFRVLKAFGLFRLAAIAQGVYMRSLQGNASGEGAGMFRAAVGHLAGVALGLLE
ncbi:MAG: phosphotransferase family protein [Myxococcota bacterium]